MILSDNDIRKNIEEGKIKIDPAPDWESQLGPCSLDLHLGNAFKIFKPTQCPFLDTNKKMDFEQIMETIIIEDDKPFIMQPKDFVLAVTKENITLPPDLMGRLDGRSSLGRLGLVVHSTAARFDPGWTGHAVLEFGNLGPMPIMLYPGMRVCTMTFENLSSVSGIPYTQQKDHKYAGQSTPVASQLNKEDILKP
jgi:dCTP deaminase